MNAEPTNAPLEGGGDADALGAEQAALYKRRAMLGAIAMIARTIVLQVVIFACNIVLARKLDPRDFGVFGVLQFALAFFAFFGDAGLGAALVQKKQPPKEREVASVFGFQMGVSLVIVGALVLGARGMGLLWRDLPSGYAWLVRVMSLNLLLVSARVVPSILMERELKFGRLAVLEVVRQTGFYAATVVLALMGHGVWSLVMGVLAEGIIGVVLAYALHPWRPRVSFDWPLLRPIVRYGVSYQVKGLIGFVNGATMPIYAGAALGTKAFGLISWAQTTAYFPIKLVEIMARVTFPLLSRFQTDEELFAQSLTRSVQVCVMGTLFFVGLFLGLGPNVTVIVFTAKWLPAVPVLYVFSAAISIGFLSPLIAAALDAMNKPGVFWRIALSWTIFNWIMVAIATPRWGMLGFAVGYSVHVVIGNVVIIFVTKKLIPKAKLWPRVRGAIVGGVAVGLASHFALKPWVVTWPRLVAGMGGLLALFAAVVLVIDRQMLKDTLALIPKRQRAASVG